MRTPRRRISSVLDAERELLVRLARPADRDELERLATLDSQAPLEGEALLAELDGTPVAALSLRDRRLIADPFEHTAAAGDHLRLRASSIASPNGRAGPLKRLVRSVQDTWRELNYLQRRLVQIQMDAEFAPTRERHQTQQIAQPEALYAMPDAER